MRRYFSIWWRLAVMSAGATLATPLGSLGFLLGKLIRLACFVGFLVAMFRHTPSLAGYNLAQVLVFFMTFNLVDVFSQLLFRGIYGIGRRVRDGYFDYYLVQPVRPLFRAAFHTFDLLDLLTLPPVLALTIAAIRALPVRPGPTESALFVLLLASGVALAFAIHVAVASASVTTQSAESGVWIYRDLMTLARYPSDIYAEGVRLLLTTVLPVAVIVTFPAKALMGLLSTGGVLYALALAAAANLAAARTWAWALRRYTSVPS